jgi:SAM-dependent methyltransferase
MWKISRLHPGGVRMTNYIFDNAAERETAERFASLGSLHDPHTIRHLLGTGVGRGWRCLEIGGGSGSIAQWLADRVGLEGHVLATDIDPRFLASAGRANLEVRRHDVGTDPLPESAYDLIHTRLVLIHVPQREATIGRLVSALKPGGWLVVEDYDPIAIDRTFPIENDEQAATARKCLHALRTLMESRGMDMGWANSLYRRFVAAGLVDVAMLGHIDLRSGGSPGARLDRANFAQVRDEALLKALVTPEEIDRMLSLLDDPGFVFASPIMFSASGQRPKIAI